MSTPSLFRQITALAVTCATVFAWVWLPVVQPLLVSTALAYEDGGGGGGGSPASSGSSGNGGAGSHAGHELQRLTFIAVWLANRVYPSVLNPEKQTASFSDDERAFVCAMSRVRVYEQTAMQDWLPGFLATLIHRSEDDVKQAMTPTACARR